MNEEPVVDGSIGSLTFDWLSGLLLTVVVMLVVVVVVVAVVPSKMNKMKSIVMLGVESPIPDVIHKTGDRPT